MRVRNGPVTPLGVRCAPMDRPRHATALRARPASAVACACALACSAPRAVSAQPAEAVGPESVEALAREARALYEAGQHEQAVAAYLRAWRAEPTTAVLYNIAVIYDRKLDEPDLAADYYRRYIKAEDADPAAVERATLRLRALKARASEAPPPEARSKPAHEAEPPIEARVAKATPAAEPPAEGRRTLGWVSLGIGGAVLTGGGVLAALALGAHNDFAQASTFSAKVAARDRGESLSLAADVSFGVAAVGIGLGVWWLLSARDDAAGEAASSISGAPLPGGGVVSLGGRL